VNTRIQILSFVKKASWPHRYWFYLGATAVIVASAASTGVGYFFKLITEALTYDDTAKVVFLGLLYPVLIFFIQLTYRLSGYAISHFQTNVSKTATDDLITYLLYQPHGYFVERFAGSVANKVKNVTGALDQIIPDIIWSQLDTLVTFLVALILLWSVDSSVAMAFVLLLMVLAIINMKIAPGKAAVSKANAEAGTLLQGKLVDVITNSSAVRQYVRQTYEIEGLEELTEKKQEIGLKNWLFTEKVLLLNACAVFIFVFTMFFFLVNLWQEGSVTAGDFVLVATLISHLSGTMLFVGRAFNATARSFGELREGLDDIFVPYEITDTKEAVDLTVPKGKIEFETVSFSYHKNQIFDGLSITIEPRQKVGIVGTSGAGKSTLVSLLLRQHDVEGGQIKIDGQDISIVTQDSLRKAVALVPQEPLLFHRSIFDNIAYGAKNATRDMVERAAALAHASEFIEMLAEGYETMVGERGVKLSGGQKQRVAIARAILKDAPILILDEATSALDSESEVHIQAALRKLMEGRTVIAVAHRLSTLREMDRIIVIESGKIVEDGTHESLVACNGQYAQLWSHQAGGFIVE
jgi:ATP-binding cassette subfamily B protein